MAIAVIILYLLVLRCHLYEAQSTDPLFEIDPIDAIVEIGGDASFQCILQQQQECKLQWVYYKTGCSVDSFSTFAYCGTVLLVASVDTTRFSATFDENGNVNEANFGIANVNANDTGYYACLMRDSGQSKWARLTVVQPPTPECSSSPSNPRVGETVALDCRVPATAAISSKLTWHWETSSQVKLSQTISPGTSFRISHILKETDNFKSFTCVAGNDIDAGPRCSVYPLRINLTVSVVLLQTHRPNQIEGITLELKCDATSIPTTTRHTWSLLDNANRTEPEWMDIKTTQGRYQLTDSGRYLRIVNATRKDDGLKVKCFASNDIMSVTSEPVTIVHCDETDKFVSSATQCRVRNPQSEQPSYVGIAVLYFIAFLAIISVIVHILLIRREKNVLSTSLELAERQNQY